ncbi:MAG: undecaprenyl/decaprenyl-phosphate alpha-N-acetylglucosaminyl 1-phosphate transferase [Alistipes sp.]|nr:undecaprenyl/decaprenyl-phosphate alpha-N-acetylglucosaminyl 1-phosphate transferase [Alistipes sp.]
MVELFSLLLPFVVAMMVVVVTQPSLVKIAQMKQIVDNPSARKLNKKPVPVLGGVAIFFGVIFSVGVAGYYVEGLDIEFEIIIAMLVMLYTGVGDDILQLSPSLRFALQIFTVGLMMFLGGIYIDNFHGLWGIYRLPWYVAVGLTTFSCVGIINAINLIDGVDGLCSGFGVFASLLFAVCFRRMGDISYVVLSLAVAGALIPFMLHNIFGKRYKMFLGDGGSLVLGFICSLYVMRIIQSGDEVVTGSTISFTLAVLAVPVFDTVRVMAARIINRRSPFSADKTHLHHMFIDLGFSHVATSVVIILLDALVVMVWHMCNVWNLSPEYQLYVTITTGVWVTSGLYYGIDYIKRQHEVLYDELQKNVKRYKLQNTGFLIKLRDVLDK